MAVTSEIIVEPLASTLGATVRGVRLAALDDAGWEVIEEAFNTYALLLFPGQHLSDDEQMAFGRRFGQLEQGLTLAPLSNVTAQGEVRPADGVVMQMLRGNEGWHTDSSYMPLAAKASMLSAHVVPQSGGETEWADMRAAYDALDDAMRARISTLSAFHSIRYSQARLGFAEVVDGSYGYDVDDPPLRPLVKVHPATSRPALYIGRHAHAIPGLAADQSEQLLTDLLEFACRPPRTHRHRWVPGDIAVWDNRCVLHHACGYDYGEPRVMKHTRISGEATEVASHCGYPTESQRPVP
jgi:alpha-ketoglutarate-dependent taurine dioxygenase